MTPRRNSLALPPSSLLGLLGLSLALIPACKERATPLAQQAETGAETETGAESTAGTESATADAGSAALGALAEVGWVLEPTRGEGALVLTDATGARTRAVFAGDLPTGCARTDGRGGKALLSARCGEDGPAFAIRRGRGAVEVIRAGAGAGAEVLAELPLAEGARVVRAAPAPGAAADPIEPGEVRADWAFTAYTEVYAQVVPANGEAREPVFIAELIGCAEPQAVPAPAQPATGSVLRARLRCAHGDQVATLEARQIPGAVVVEYIASGEGLQEHTVASETISLRAPSAP
ncbi:hypothetical protein [Haliangium ochraceum]|uniref:Lipoprotein n=1 Tax=Haliangium ochraceum (strain DSM 14365 / JCM 11303 / SMP-2) TaxID=502025 RepID=D0LQ67_HALO1|nr:hypothetical protein [Haliangium ochraceum]ACY17104.1 hypothetical protein Hoch_4613 [Haliangium ochraceum DSM 14365]